MYTTLVTGSIPVIISRVVVVVHVLYCRLYSGVICDYGISILMCIIIFLDTNYIVGKRKKPLIPSLLHSAYDPESKCFNLHCQIYFHSDGGGASIQLCLFNFLLSVSL